MARASALRHGERRACTMVLPNGMEASLTFQEVHERSEAFAAFLRAKGIKRGERVLISLPDCPAYVVCSLGAFKAGVVLVNSNPLYTEHELLEQLRDCSPSVVVGLDKFGDKISRAAQAAGVPLVVLGKVADFFSPLKGALIRTKLRLSREIPAVRGPSVSLASALKQGRADLERHGPVQVPLGRDDVALLQYTGGTTGVSKGAMLTHGNLLANLAQIAEITRGCLNEGDETVLTVLPLYHVFAFTINHLYSFHCGFHNVLVPNPRPLRNLEPALRHKITWTTGVNTLLKGLLREPWFVAQPPRGLKVVFAGGMEVEPAVREGWEERVGSVVVEGYGLSESSPLVTFNPFVPGEGGPRRSMQEAGGAGLPLPGTEVTIVGEDGAALGPGERGEILVRGPQVMLGYWQRPEESQRTLEGGWLHTGDIGTMAESGYLRITDRKKDMIVVSGFKVFPAEVEACIATHPNVADVAVIGVPDERTGEVVRAFVVPRSPPLTAEEVIAYCRPLLTPYKLPRAVAFLRELPKSPVGKTLRRELRAMMALSHPASV
ncbi:MAG TPA: long-chain fatty acid--CoA ligase [Myxococcales bacterium]|jgi:long-chain acyl-CoA synthetase